MNAAVSTLLSLLILCVWRCNVHNASQVYTLEKLGVLLILIDLIVVLVRVVMVVFVIVV